MSEQKHTMAEYKRAFGIVDKDVDYEALLEEKMANMQCADCPVGRYCRTTSDGTHRCVDVVIAYTKEQEASDGKS